MISLFSNSLFFVVVFMLSSCSSVRTTDFDQKNDHNTIAKKLDSVDQSQGYKQNVFPELIADLPFLFVNKTPRFNDVPESISERDNRKYFQEKVKEHLKSNFNKDVTDRDLLIRDKVKAQFIIDESGEVTEIVIVAENLALEKEFIRVLNMLPRFVPGKHNGSKVRVLYAVSVDL